MLINEVCSKCQLTRKTVRYYEEEGLLRPKRNEINDYRVYDEDDVILLKKIKFLRELGVSIGNIKSLVNGDISLYDSIREQVKRIEQEENNYLRVKNMCNEILKNYESLEELDVDNYFLGFNILNKEGFTMRNVKTSKRKAIIGATISTLVFVLFFLVMIIPISYFQFTASDSLPYIVYGIFMFVLGVPVVGAIYNYVIRIKEILGGEEDEASKY